MQFWFPTLCLHSWRRSNGCFAHGTLGVSAGCCCCCCLQFVVMVNVLTMTPSTMAWGRAFGESMGRLRFKGEARPSGKNDCVVRDDFSLWTASWQPSWEGGSVCDSRFIERVRGEWASPARLKQHWDVCVCVYVCMRGCACVCALRRVTSAPRWVARGGGVGEWLWLQCPSSATIRALIQPDPPHVLTHTPLHLSQVFIFILTQ